MDFLGFALAVLLIELTPGPNMAWLAGVAGTAGTRAGWAATVGIAVGLLANGLLAALGLAALLQSAPGLWSALRLAGAAMMGWLAVETWRGASAQATVEPAAGPVRRAFATGALINLLNPKAYLFFIVIAPQFLHGAALDLPSAVLLSLISTAIATAVHLVIVALGGRAHDWLSDPRRTRTVRLLFAVTMGVVALSFLLADLT